ncbi:MAG: hypothetical protein JNL98_24795 [Bryobacterales bacterium]|nr:hypothetical protein [Bryobacterales bacterium]
MSEQVTIAIVVPTLFLTAAYILTTIARVFGRARRDRLMAELHGKLIDRLGSGPDVIQFFQTEAGQKFLAGGEHEAPPTHVSRVLNSLQTGLIALSTGIGMYVVAPMSYEAAAFFRVAGGIAIAAGIGIVLSAGWSFVLLRKWGLLTDSQKQ